MKWNDYPLHPKTNKNLIKSKNKNIKFGTVEIELNLIPFNSI
jgi:hypothetical protein